MVYCLAIDTVSAKPSVAINRGGETFSCNLSVGRKQSQTLLDEVEALLKDVNINYNDLTELAVLTGPGSFTGVRVGLSFLKGLSIALKVPLFGEQHFDILKPLLPEKGTCLILLEAGRDEKFGQFANNGQLLGEAFNMDLEEIKNKFSDMFEKCEYFISDFKPDLPDFIKEIPYDINTAELLIKSYRKNTSESISPFYIRQADTTIAQKII